MQSTSTLLNSIRQSFLSGQFKDATEACLQGLVDSPDDPELHFLLALCDEKQGQTDDALARLERVVRDEPRHTDARFALGRLLAARGQAESARTHLNECLELDPGHAAARTIRARLDFGEGRSAEAVSGLKTALRADEDHVPALVSLAEILLDQGDVESANQHASHALEVSPNNASAQIAMARVFMAKGLFSFAERCLANAAEYEPGNPVACLLSGEVLQRSGRHAEAVEQFEKARQLGLADRAVARGLATSLARSGRLQEARRVFDALSPTAADRDLVLDLADLHAAAGDAAALQALAESGGDLPADLCNWLKALAYEVADAPEEALGLAADLLQAEDFDLQVRARLLAARLNLHQGRPEPLVDVLGPLVEEGRVTAAVHWEMARLLRAAELFELADRSLQHVAGRKDVDADNRARTQSMRLDVLDRAGRYEEALALFAEAAWQPPYIGEPGYLAIDGEDEQALAPLKRYEWSREGGAASPTDQPLFIAGWPCAGRDLLLAALSTSGALDVLSLADWPQRKRHLGLPLDVAGFGRAPSSRLHLMRRRYARYFSGKRRPVESASVQPLDMAQIARLFPTAVVVNPVAEENYLAMQWRLMGYRQVPTMLKAWRQDGQLLARLRELLPIEIIDVSLDALLSDPQATLADLCPMLGLSYHQNMSKAVERLADSRGYRPPQHWKHYFPAE
jgi:tetratricopeptide (TPR) repeat protein